MTNIEIQIFYNNLLDLINKSGLQVGTMYFIIKDVYHEVEKLFQQCINNEMQDEQIVEHKNINLEQQGDNGDESTINSNASEHSWSNDDN